MISPTPDDRCPGQADANDQVADDEQTVAPDARSGAVRGDPDLDVVLVALSRIQDSFEEKIRYDEVRERQIAALHEELQEYRRGLYRQILSPLLSDLISLHDEIAKAAGDAVQSDGDKAAAGSQNARTTLSTTGFLLDSVEEILLRYGVTSFSCAGDEVDRARQKVIAVTPTAEKSLDRRVAWRLRPGFEMDGKIIRPEWINAYRYAPGAGDLQAGDLDSEPVC